MCHADGSRKVCVCVCACVHTCCANGTLHAPGRTILWRAGSSGAVIHATAGRSVHDGHHRMHSHQFFDILPLHGKLLPGQRDVVEFSFYAAPGAKASAIAACAVVDGPTYQVRAHCCARHLCQRACVMNLLPAYSIRKPWSSAAGVAMPRVCNM